MPDSAARLDLAVHLTLAARSRLEPGTWDISLLAPFWRVYHHDRPGVRLTLPDQVLDVPAGRLVVIPAGCGARGTCRAITDQAYLHLDVVGLPDVWVRQVLGRPVLLRRDAAWEPAIAVLRRGPCDQFTVPPMDALRLGAFAHAAVATAIEATGPEALADLDRLLACRKRIAPALQVMHARPHQMVDVARLAQACDLSEEHFRRLFRRDMGLSPARWQLQQRIERAARRLVNSDDPIDRLADDLGFANRFHFSRAFTRILGESPAAYRKLRQPVHARVPS